MNQSVTLDGTEVKLPDGVKELSQELFYDDELKGVFYRIDNDLTFSDDGYDYLSDIVFRQSICSQVEFILSLGNEGLHEIFNGIIHISDFTELDPVEGIYKTPIADNNISSYVFNNQNIKGYTDVPLSKNGVEITVPAGVAIDFFTPSTCTYTVPGVKCWSADDCFRFIVAFISDGLLTYSSPFFGSGGAGEHLYLTTGENLRLKADTNTDADHPVYASFAELFREFDKIFNLSFTILYGVAPQLIIDRTENLYTDDLQFTFSDVHPKIKIDKERFFSKVILGSSKTQTNDDSTFTMQDIEFLGFKREEYSVGGQCNIDRELNLVNEFIIDTNTIEDIIVNLNSSYDDDIIIVETNQPVDNNATQFENINGPATCIYNLGLNNASKANNYLGAIPNSIALYISTLSNNFKAVFTDDNNYFFSTGDGQDIIYPDDTAPEGYDPNDNYNVATGKYTAIIEGVYNFSAVQAILTDIPIGALVAIGTQVAELKMSRFDSSDVLQEEIGFPIYIISVNRISFHPTDIQDVITINQGYYMYVGDYIKMTIDVDYANFLNLLKYYNGNQFCFFAATAIQGEGGVYQTYDPNDYKVLSVEFEYPLSYSLFESLKNNIQKKVKITAGRNIFKGWIKSISRNIVTGISKIAVRTSNNTIK